MSFQDTYANEVLLSRRTRSQRALFWAKVTGFLLMILVAATLRSEPKLIQAFVQIGANGVLAATGKSAAPSGQQSASSPQLPGLPQNQQMTDLLKAPGLGQMFDMTKLSDPSQMPDMSQIQGMLMGAGPAQTAPVAQAPQPSRPRDAVRVNRHFGSQSSLPQFQSAPAAHASPASLPRNDQATAVASDLSKLLKAMKPGQ